MAAAARPQVRSEVDVRAAPGPGRLVTLEGVDGSGKSTLAQALHQRFEQRGVAAVLTREPTRSWLGESVKRAIRESSDPFVEAFLFLADHADHTPQVEQWLSLGRVVISDRWADSCLAYQGAALEPLLKPRGFHAMEWLTAAQQPFTRPPDVCLLLDLAPAKALERIGSRPETIKYEEVGFLERVRRNYHHLAKRMPYYEILDAAQPPDKLLEIAWASLARRGIAPP